MNEDIDIGAELYDKIHADFLKQLGEARELRSMADVSGYSGRVGRALSRAIAANLSPDVLPDGRLYYNIARSILEPSLRENHELVNSAAEQVQRELDEREGIRIKPVRPEFPTERVNDVISAASAEDIPWEKTLRRVTSPAETITMSFADDFMKANAEKRSRAGFDTFIDRQGGGKCCPWCAKLIGHFKYPDNVPKDVYRRHDNCTCTVTYGTKGGARQKVWSKQTWSSEQEREYLRLRDEEKKKAGGKRLTEKQVAAIIAKVGSQPHKLTHKEALARGGFAQPRRLTGGANGGIIKTDKLPDETVGRSVGAKSKAVWARMPDGTEQALVEGSRITNKKIIAGKGRDRKIDIEDVLNYRHPEATPGEWVKIKGIGSIYDETGEERRAELHWYENPSVSGKIDLKVKPRNGVLYIDDD